MFYINPIRFELADTVFFAAVAVALVAAVGLYAAARFQRVPAWKRFLTRLSVATAVFGIAGAVWAGCRYELVPWFGTHFAFLLLAVCAGIWKVKIIWSFCRSCKAELAAWNKAALKDKYLSMSSK